MARSTTRAALFLALALLSLAGTPRARAGELATWDRHAFWSLREEMQVLVSSSRRLHRALADGAGQEETFPTYRRLLNAARRAEREARRIALAEPALGRIYTTAEAIRRIRPFYEAEPPL
jgi:hypothetical protein